jgi:hypothetical protein
MTSFDRTTELSERQLDRVSGGSPLQQVDTTLSIGSQPSGAGAGKETLNPFQITRKSDRASPTFFKMC